MNHNLLKINSQDRTAGSHSTSNFLVNFGNNDACTAITKVVLKSVDIPNVFYNINKNNNKFLHSDGTYTIVPVGQYTIDDLILVLKTTDNKITDITVNNITKKIQITFTTAASLLGPEDGNLIGKVLGILETDNTISTVHNLNGFVNLSGLSEVFIISNACCDGNNLITHSGKSIGVLGVIPITVEYGRVEHYTSDHPELDHFEFASQREGSSLTEIDIKLTDSEGNELDLGGLDINIILKVFHYHP